MSPAEPFTLSPTSPVVAGHLVVCHDDLRIMRLCKIELAIFRTTSRVSSRQIKEATCPECHVTLDWMMCQGMEACEEPKLLPDFGVTFGLEDMLRAWRRRYPRDVNNALLISTLSHLVSTSPHGYMRTRFQGMRDQLVSMRSFIPTAGHTARDVHFYDYADVLRRGDPILDRDQIYQFQELATAGLSNAPAITIDSVGALFGAPK